MRTLTATLALTALAACSSGEAGRYTAATGKLETAQERLDAASAEFIATQQRCAAEASDDCISQAERLSAELADAHAARRAAAEEIATTKRQQAEAFSRGLAVMEQAQGEPGV